MLVPAMTPAEIRKEIEKDIPILIRKSLYVGNELRRTNSPMQKKQIARCFDYLSKYNNNWKYKVDITKKSTICAYMAYFYSDRGLTAIEYFYQTKLIMFFSAHFFKRFNERLKLDIVLPKDLLNKFVSGHAGYQLATLDEIDDNLESVFGVIPDGVLLGTYHKDLNYVNVNTFVTHDMLKGTQLEKEKELRELAKKHWH